MNEEDDTQATTPAHNPSPELEQPPAASVDTISAPTPPSAPPQSPPESAPQSVQFVAPVQSPAPVQPIQHSVQYITQTPPAHPLQQPGQYMAQPQSPHPVQQLPMPGYQVSVAYPAPMPRQMQPMHGGYQIQGPQPNGHPQPAGHHYPAMAQPQTHPMNTGAYPSNPQPQLPPASKEPVIHIQPEPSLPSIFGDKPQMICCPECKKTGETKISYEIGNCAWMGFCLCFWTAALTLCSPCAFCIQQWQDVNHYCSHCNHLVGSYKR